MIDIEVKIDPQTKKRTERMFVNLGKSVQKPIRVLKRIGELMVVSILKNFEAEGRPIKWESLKPMTLAMRKKGKSKGKPKILQDKGFLHESFTTDKAIRIHEDESVSVAVGTNIKYAPIHQFGGTARIKARIIVPKKAKALRFVVGTKVIFAKKVRQKARTVVIPQRKFLLFQEEDIEDIRNEFVNSIRESIINQ